MSQTLTPETINNAIAAFQLEGSPRDVHSYGNGHINDTYLVTYGDA